MIFSITIGQLAWTRFCSIITVKNNLSVHYNSIHSRGICLRMMVSSVILQRFKQ